jgi:protoporphyrin/coproporphyrin ferrochelatase
VSQVSSVRAAATTVATDVLQPGWDAVLLAGFGGPEGPDDVMPFLRNVTRGRGIPDERLVEVAHHYDALGGVSPINEQNRALRAALQDELSRRGVDLPVLWGNRNWAPYLTDVVRDAHATGRSRLLGLATSAYSSYSSCRQYREDFGKALADTELVGEVRIDKVRLYHNHPGFLMPFVDGLREALTAASQAGVAADSLVVLFSTHSIPSTMALSAGPVGTPEPGAYVSQHLAAARWVVEAIGAPLSWRLVYQSRSGPPQMPWLEPDINDAITDLAAGGTAGVIVVPIGFVSDHVEVIWDLDNEARQTAAEHDLWFHRVATPGVDPRFVSALADLVEERLNPGRPRATVAGGPSPDFCGARCCRNLRSPRPTTAGMDSADDWAGTDVSPADLRRSGILSAGASPANP